MHSQLYIALAKTILAPGIEPKKGLRGRKEVRLTFLGRNTPQRTTSIGL